MPRAKPATAKAKPVPDMKTRSAQRAHQRNVNKTREYKLEPQMVDGKPNADHGIPHLKFPTPEGEAQAAAKAPGGDVGSAQKPEAAQGAPLAAAWPPAGAEELHKAWVDYVGVQIAAGKSTFEVNEAVQQMNAVRAYIDNPQPGVPVPDGPPADADPAPPANEAAEGAVIHPDADPAPPEPEPEVIAVAPAKQVLPAPPLMRMTHPDNGTSDGFQTDATGAILVPHQRVEEMKSHGFVVDHLLEEGVADE